MRRGLELANIGIELSPGLVVACTAAEIGAVTCGGAFLTDMLMRLAIIYKQDGETFHSASQLYMTEGHWLESIKTAIKFFGHAVGWTTGYQIADYFYHSQDELHNFLVRGCSAAIGSILPTLPTMCYAKDVKPTILISQLATNLFEGFFRSIIVDSHLCDAFLKKGDNIINAKIKDVFSVGGVSALIYTIGVLVTSSVRGLAASSHPTLSSTQLDIKNPSLQQDNISLKKNQSLVSTLCHGVWNYIKTQCCPLEATDDSIESEVLPPSASALKQGIHAENLPPGLSYVHLSDSSSAYRSV